MEHPEWLGTYTKDEVEMFLNGEGIAKNPERAYKCFAKSAEKHDPKGMYNQAICLYNGLGCKKDPKLAFNLFKEASEAGYKKAMYNLYICYLNGVGCKKDLDLASKWKENFEK